METTDIDRILASLTERLPVRLVRTAFGDDAMLGVMNEGGDRLGVIVVHEGRFTAFAKGDPEPLVPRYPSAAPAECVRLIAQRAGDRRLADLAYWAVRGDDDGSR